MPHPGPGAVQVAGSGSAVIGPGLQQRQPPPADVAVVRLGWFSRFDRPFHILRQPEQPLDVPGQRGHRRRLVGGNRVLHHPFCGSCRPDHPPLIAGRLTAHQPFGNPPHRRHHGLVPVSGNRVGREGDPSRDRRHHRLHQHRHARGYIVVRDAGRRIALEAVGRGGCGLPAVTVSFHVGRPGQRARQGRCRTDRRTTPRAGPPRPRTSEPQTHPPPGTEPPPQPPDGPAHPAVHPRPSW